MSYLKASIIALIALFAPAKQVIYTSLALVLLDLITGLVAAKKRGEAITSSGLKRTAIKLAVYEVAILAAFLTEQYLTLDILPVCKIVTSFIGVVELKSVLENLNSISGGDLLKALIDKLSRDNES